MSTNNTSNASCAIKFALTIDDHFDRIAFLESFLDGSAETDEDWDDWREYRRATPPAPEPWGWLCNGKGDGWEEHDKVVRDPAEIARMRTMPDKWRIEPLYLHPPSPAPDGWVMVPREPTQEMIEAATPGASEWIGHPEAKPASIERWRQGHRKAARRIYRSIISAAPAAPAAEGLMDALKSAEKALRPFYNAVFNDNADMTVHGGYRYHEAVTGYWAYKRVRAMISAAPAAPTEARVNVSPDLKARIPPSGA